MAVTGFWPVKGQLKAVLDYADNPDKTTPQRYLDSDLYDTLKYVANDAKTDRTMFVAGINCSKQNAYGEMVAVQKRFGNRGSVVAYHGIQSFRAGEVTPETAFEIGKETARRMWGDRYQVLVTVHLNTENIHCHFVVNPVSFKDGSKFQNKIGDHKELRKISDAICREHGLSVLENSDFYKHEKKAYWLHRQGKKTHRDMLREDVEYCLTYAKNWEQFEKQMVSRGYSIDQSRLSVKAANWQRPVRLSSLGYTKEVLRSRFDEMLTAVIASCAQAESESISRNMRWSVQKRMESGTFNTCRAATGFRLSEDGLRIAPEEAPVIYGIFADYLQGKNSREIAERLNAENALGRIWNRKLVDYILTNERYAGNAILQKKYRTETFPRIKKPNRGERPMYFVQNSNPAIITQEMFDRAAQLRSSRRNETCNMEARPFAKKLSCGCCGSLLRSKRIDNTWYWVCRKHEESNALCEMPPVPENEIKAAFLRLHYSLKHNTAVLDFYVKHLILVRNRQMLWSSDAIKLNKEISDILGQSHTLSLLNRQGMVDPDIFISKNNQLAGQLRKAKQQKEKLHNLEHDQVIEQTQQLQETLLTGPEILDAFDEELFCELIDRITVQSNTQVRFRLKNGLELTESMERTVR